MHTNARVSELDGALCNGHKFTNVRSELWITRQRLKLWSKETALFGEWQNELAERLSGKKTASMGKYGTPATKTMENRRISSEGKRSMNALLSRNMVLKRYTK